MLFKFDVSLVSLTKADKRAIPDPEFDFVPDFQTGYEYIYFVPKLSGFFNITIGSLNVGSVNNTPLQFDVIPGGINVPSCIGKFTTENKFVAGARANVLVQLLDAYGSGVYNGSYDFTVSVEGKVGASRFISDVNVTAPGVMMPGYMVVTFSPTTAGTYGLQIGDGLLYIKNSPMPFSVTAGSVYVPFCMAEWVDDVDSFIAGEIVKFRVLLFDAFNNNVSDSTGKPGSFFKFNVTVLKPDGNTSSVKNIQQVPDPYESGYVVITFTILNSGTNYLHIGNGTDFIFNSPLTFLILSGPVSPADCFIEWPYGVNDFQIDNNVNVIVNKRDVYGNPVPDDYDFQVVLYRTDQTAGVKLLAEADTFPIDELNVTTMDPVSSGKVLYEFLALAGVFQLEVLAGNVSIKGSPAPFTTFVGVVNPTNGTCTGDGYTGATAGGTGSFDLQLLDADGDPAYEMGANVSQRKTVKATLTLGTYTLQAIPTPDPTEFGLYHFSYTTTKSGIYNITVTWMYNIICQGLLTIAPGPVVVSKSVITGKGLGPKIPRNTLRNLTITLQDQWGNYVQGQRDRLRWKIDGSGGSGTKAITSRAIGYATAYTIFETGSYSLTITYDNTPLPGCPIKIIVMAESSFPRAIDDTVWTWEQVSILIDVLANDITSSGAKKLTGFAKPPRLGSVVIDNGKARYTPKKGYNGRDNFTYILTETVASSLSIPQSSPGFVFVLIRTEPPDFTFWPKALVAVEGQPISTADDFDGFYIDYTNETELLKLEVKAEHGHVYLPADAPQLWHDVAQTAVPDAYTMILVGTVVSINRALDDFLYVGDPYYNGKDTLLFSVRNTNDTGDTITIAVQVLPYNNAPFILAPDHVLKDKNGALKSLSGDTVAFKVKNPIIGITVGDPDVNDIREDKKVHRLEITLETTAGSISIQLPRSAADSAEYRLENNHLWNPCLTAVIGNNLFPVQAQAVRFRGTVAECNIALSTITYNGTVDGEGLNIIVNDMGNFGCIGDCTERAFVPITTQKLIMIYTKVPRSSWWAFMKEARIYGSTVGSVGFAALTFLCLMYGLSKRVERNIQRAQSKESEEAKDDQACDATRVYNPLWIPAAGAGENREVLSAPNPLIIQQRQQELRQRIREVELEVENLKNSAKTESEKTS